jgi:RecB family endonuclease NucS
MNCIDAIREVFDDDPGVLTAKEVQDRIYEKHPDKPWKPPTIMAHLAGLSRNHPSSKHYPTAHKQAFLHWEIGGKFRAWTPEDDADNDSADIDDDSETLKDEIELGPASTALSLERDLELSLLSNLEQLESGLKLYVNDGVKGQQFNAGDVARIDILAVGPQNELVVIELKAGTADDKVMGQILRYMGWIKGNLAAGMTVRGIVVANDFTVALKYAAIAVPTVSLKRYEIKFEFTDAGSQAARA